MTSRDEILTQLLLDAFIQEHWVDEAMAQHGVMKAGIDFLAKPFTPATLVRKVRELLDQPKAPTANPAR